MSLMRLTCWGSKITSNSAPYPEARGEGVTSAG